MEKITVKADQDHLPGKNKPSAGPLFSFDPPVDNEFTWVNQGSSVIEDLDDSLALTIPASSVGNMRMRVQNVPQVPYSVEMAFLMPIVRANYSNAGFVWRDSVSGKIVGVQYGGSGGGAYVFVNKYNSPTSWNSSPVSIGIDVGFGYPFFLKVTDDGTNHKAFFSSDGQVWTEFYSEASSGFLTANQIGFNADTSTNQFPLTMTLLHWKVEEL